MLNECKDYLETQMRTEDSIVKGNKLFQDIKVLPKEDDTRETLLTWVWRGQTWEIFARKNMSCALIDVEIIVPEDRHWTNMWLSHVQHLTVVMGLITNWFAKEMEANNA